MGKAVFQFAADFFVRPTVKESSVMPDVSVIFCCAVDFQHFEKEIFQVRVKAHFSRPKLAAQKFFCRPYRVKVEVVRKVLEFAFGKIRLVDFRIDFLLQKFRRQE